MAKSAILIKRETIIGIMQVWLVWQHKWKAEQYGEKFNEGPQLLHVVKEQQSEKIVVLVSRKLLFTRKEQSSKVSWGVHLNGNESWKMLESRAERLCCFLSLTFIKNKNTEILITFKKFHFKKLKIFIFKTWE